jgi:RND family efflux transporter MFP subunit
MLNVGDMAAGQMPIVTLTQKDLLKIIVDVIEKDIRLVKKGQNVNVYVDVFPERVFKGEVVRISPVVDAATRTSQVEILLKNPDNALTPGMFARLEIIVQSKDNVLLVNRNNLDVRTSRHLNGGSIRDTEIEQIFSVFVVEDNLALEKEIEVGIRSGLWLEVVSGLKEGDRVVSAGRTNLRDSTMVNIVKVNS